MYINGCSARHENTSDIYLQFYSVQRTMYSVQTDLCLFDFIIKYRSVFIIVTKSMKPIINIAIAN